MKFEKLERRFCPSGFGKIKDNLHKDYQTINDFAVDVSGFVNTYQSTAIQNQSTVQQNTFQTQTNPTFNGFEMRYENGVIVCYVVGTFEFVNLYSPASS